MANKKKNNSWVAAEEEEIEHHDTEGHPELFQDLGTESTAPGDEDEEDDEEEDDEVFTGSLKSIKSPSYKSLLDKNKRSADKIV